MLLFIKCCYLIFIFIQTLFEEFLWFKEKKIKLGTKLPDILQNELRDLYTEYTLMSSYPAIVLEKSIEKKEFKLKQII